MPRLRSRNAPLWPEGEPARASLVERGSGWWTLTVGEGLPAGVEVEALVVLYPPATVEEALPWDAGPEVEIQSVPGREDALFVRGVTPLEVLLERTSPAQEFALAVRVDRTVLGGEAVRYGERLFSDANRLSLYLPDWIPGVTMDLLGPESPGVTLPVKPGHLVITRTGPLLHEEHRAPADLEERNLLRELGGRE